MVVGNIRAVPLVLWGNAHKGRVFFVMTSSEGAGDQIGFSIGFGEDLLDGMGRGVGESFCVFPNPS